MRYKWNLEKLQGWQIALIDNMGLPLEFDSEQLTDEQYKKLQFVMIIKELTKEGLIEPEYKDGDVCFHVTKKGEKLLRRYRKISLEETKE
jgi:DNA-binding MarR family transcriptional regulator